MGEIWGRYGLRCMGVGERWGWSLGKGHGRRTCGCADPVRFLPPRPASVQPPLQPLGILTQPLRYLLPVLGRYHEDVALAELRPELRALDACIELVAVDRLDEQFERAHLVRTRVRVSFEVGVRDRARARVRVWLVLRLGLTLRVGWGQG